MKIATWNVNSIRSRQEQVVNWLQENNIDILCLQETKVIDTQFPTTPFEELGYYTYIYGQKSYNGVAIFSRQPMEQVITGFTPIVGEYLAEEFEPQKRVITGIVQGIRIVNLYVPNGAEVGSDKYQYKLRWLDVLAQYLQTINSNSSEEMCVCGDFNIAPEDKDIYNPQGRENKIMSSPPERQALQKVLDIALQDVFRKFNTEGGHFTWWDYRAGSFQRNRGWRIDHHYLTPSLYSQAISCTIDINPRKLAKPSDHAPVIVEF